MKFSIRGILLATTLVALLLATYLAPTLIASATILVLWPFATTVIVGMAIYGRGLWQAFAIGAAVPTALLGTVSYFFLVIIALDSSAVSNSSYYEEVVEVLEDIDPGIRFIFAFACFMAPICGSLNVAIRWLFRERGAT